MFIIWLDDSSVSIKNDPVGESLSLNVGPYIQGIWSNSLLPPEIQAIKFDKALIPPVAKSSGLIFFVSSITPSPKFLAIFFILVNHVSKSSNSL